MYASDLDEEQVTYEFAIRNIKSTEKSFRLQQSRLQLLLSAEARNPSHVMDMFDSPFPPEQDFATCRLHIINVKREYEMKELTKDLYRKLMSRLRHTRNRLNRIPKSDERLNKSIVFLLRYEDTLRYNIEEEYRSGEIYNGPPMHTPPKLELPSKRVSFGPDQELGPSTSKMPSANEGTVENIDDHQIENLISLDDDVPIIRRQALSKAKTDKDRLSDQDILYRHKLSAIPPPIPPRRYLSQNNLNTNNNRTREDSPLRHQRISDGAIITHNNNTHTETITYEEKKPDEPKQPIERMICEFDNFMSFEENRLDEYGNSFKSNIPSTSHKPPHAQFMSPIVNNSPNTETENKKRSITKEEMDELMACIHRFDMQNKSATFKTSTPVSVEDKPATNQTKSPDTFQILPTNPFLHDMSPTERILLELARKGNRNTRVKDWNIRFSGQPNSKIRNDTDLLTFLTIIDRNKKSDDMSDEDLMKNMTQLLAEGALKWFVAQPENMTYTEFVKALKQRFFSINHDHYIKQVIANTKQQRGESVNEFIEHMSAKYRTMEKKVDEKEQAFTIRGNMLPELIRLIQPQDMHDIKSLLTLACLAEDTDRSARANQAQRTYKVNEIQATTEDFADTDESMMEALAVQLVKYVKNKRQPSCWNCKKLGHMFSKCTEPKRDNFCHKCGLDKTTTKDCPTCNSKNGVQSLFGTTGSGEESPGTSTKN